MISVWPLVDGRRDTGHITKPEPLQCRAGQWYGSIPKPGSTYGRSGNLAETTTAKPKPGVYARP